MMLRLFFVLALAFALPACGTKSALVTPDGKKVAKGTPNPSEPPNPISR